MELVQELDTLRMYHHYCNHSKKKEKLEKRIVNTQMEMIDQEMHRMVETNFVGTILAQPIIVQTQEPVETIPVKITLPETAPVEGIASLDAMASLPSSQWLPYQEETKEKQSFFKNITKKVKSLFTKGEEK